MTRCIPVKQTIDEKSEISVQALEAIGNAYLRALAAQDFETLEQLFVPEVRFRAMVPKGVREGETAQAAAAWLKKWFGGSDTLQVLQSGTEKVFDRLYLHYRLRVHDNQDGWQLIEQHAYAVVRDEQIADLWLVCSGFRSTPPPDGAAYEIT